MVNHRDQQSNQVTFDSSPLIGPIPNLICLSTSGPSSSSWYSITHAFWGCRNGRRDENSMEEEEKRRLGPRLFRSSLHPRFLPWPGSSWEPAAKPQPKMRGAEGLTPVSASNTSCSCRQEFVTASASSLRDLPASHRRPATLLILWVPCFLRPALQGTSLS